MLGHLDPKTLSGTLISLVILVAGIGTLTGCGEKAQASQARQTSMPLDQE